MYDGHFQMSQANIDDTLPWSDRKNKNLQASIPSDCRSVTAGFKCSDLMTCSVLISDKQSVLGIGQSNRQEATREVPPDPVVLFILLAPTPSHSTAPHRTIATHPPLSTKNKLYNLPLLPSRLFNYWVLWARNR